MKEIHKYTPKSVERTVYLNVFLETLIISQGFKPYNNYPRTKKIQTLNFIIKFFHEYISITYQGINF